MSYAHLHTLLRHTAHYYCYLFSYHRAHKVHTKENLTSLPFEGTNFIMFRDLNTYAKFHRVRIENRQGVYAFVPCEINLISYTTDLEFRRLALALLTITYGITELRGETANTVHVKRCKGIKQHGQFNAGTALMWCVHDRMICKLVVYSLCIMHIKEPNNRDDFHKH